MVGQTVVIAEGLWAEMRRRLGRNWQGKPRCPFRQEATSIAPAGQRNPSCLRSRAGIASIIRIFSTPLSIVFPLGGIGLRRLEGDVMDLARGGSWAFPGAMALADNGCPVRGLQGDTYPGDIDGQERALVSRESTHLDSMVSLDQPSKPKIRLASEIAPAPGWPATSGRSEPRPASLQPGPVALGTSFRRSGAQDLPPSGGRPAPIAGRHPRLTPSGRAFRAL